MKVLNSFGPNPRMLRMFMLEKNISIDFVEHDLMGAENRTDAYLAKNPGGRQGFLLNRHPYGSLHPSGHVLQNLSICFSPT